MIFYFVYEFNSSIGSLLHIASKASYTSTSIGTSPIERFPLNASMLKTSRIFCTLDCYKETLLNDVDVSPLVFGITFPFWWWSDSPLFFLGAWIDCQFIGVCWYRCWWTFLWSSTTSTSIFWSPAPSSC